MCNWISKLEELRFSSVPVVAVTVIRCSGSVPRDPGAKMLVLQDGCFFGTIGGGHLEELAISDAVKFLKEGISKTQRYPLGPKTGQCCGGVTELFFEVLNNGPSLWIFGAGHVGQALGKIMVGTPFSVHLIDERDLWINNPEIPQGALRHKSEWSEGFDEIIWSGEKTFVVVMTHRHDVDQKIIEQTLEKPVRYIGLIGSETKWHKFKSRLKVKGFDEELLARVHCPIGKKGAGKAPQEIAIHIAGDLLEEFYGRNRAESKLEEVSAGHSGRGAGLPHEGLQGAP